jgi:hypothetical protein
MWFDANKNTPKGEGKSYTSLHPFSIQSKDALQKGAQYFQLDLLGHTLSVAE